MHLQSLITKIAAIVLAGMAVFTASLYPINAVVFGTALLIYAGVLWIWPQLWLLFVPAFLPLIDLTPWTGWFFLEEVDIILLTTAAVVYWRLGAGPRNARMPPVLTISLFLLTTAYVVGMFIGLGSNPVVDANAFSNYYSPFNSLRVAKGFFWMVVLLPLLMRSAGHELVNLRRNFMPGMLIGLAGVCAASTWERMVFPGLMDFASDYRITAPFSGMHTGGAALDGYMALSLPFVAIWLVGKHSRLKTLLAIGLLVAGVFIGLATFSRGVYLAYGFAAAVFLLQAARDSRKRGALDLRQLCGVAALLALTGYVLVLVFASSGYRGLAASLTLLAAGIVLATLPSKFHRLLGTIALALVLCGVSYVGVAQSGGGAYMSVLKGPYLFFVLSLLLMMSAVAAFFIVPGRLRAAFVPIAAAAFVWIGFNTALVAQHWGGNTALTPIALVAGLAVSFVAINRLAPTPFCQFTGSTARFTLVCGVVFAIVIPLSGSYYTTSRFSTAKADLETRLYHWKEALMMMTPDGKTTALGMGLGRYPETYFWKNSFGEVPSTYRYEVEGPNAFLRLGAPRYREGFGEVIRILQRLPITPQTSYQLSLDVRKTNTSAGIRIGLCERMLLYAQECVGVELPDPTADGQWHRYTFALNSGAVGARTRLHPPTQLQLYLFGSNSVVDVDNVSLVNRATGIDLIQNGSFSNSNTNWFFSSDHYHLPWHIKNFALNIFFELGWFGLICFALLLSLVFWKLVSRYMQGELVAGIYLASLSGFLLVGLFDSLLDIPRLALLFFMVLIVSALQATPDQSPATPIETRFRTNSDAG